ncbi:nucleotidyltransferase family protein [Chlorobaculum sp. 24CR]|uniref:nucleotidyltransferase family protein n=1 Tax=Chlorobaculum sp. 24CR TaxID=2508878 RepID=UPI00352A4100
MVRNFLNPFVPEAEIIVFGLRVHGTAKPWSDLDLAIKAKSALDWKLLEEIKEAFQESELPFRVDILVWNEITPAFRKAIEGKGYEILGLNRLSGFISKSKLLVSNKITTKLTGDNGAQRNCRPSVAPC